MVNKRHAVCLVSILTGLGCSPREQAGHSSKGPTSVMEVDAMGRTLVSAVPAQLRAAFGKVSLLDFGFMVGDQNGSIGVIGRIPVSQANADSFVLPISTGPMMDGVSSVQVSNLATAPDLSTGAVTINITPNTVHGTIDLPSTAQSWTFSGRIVVTCWVPATSLAGPSSNSGGTSADSALLSDDAFASSQCMPLRHWIGQ
jgi:hypothetical protein